MTGLKISLIFDNGELKNAKRSAKVSINKVAQSHFLIIDENVANIIQSNPVNTDTKGVIKSVPKRVEFRENLRDFFLQEQSKLSVIIRCPY